MVLARHFFIFQLTECSFNIIFKMKGCNVLPDRRKKGAPIWLRCPIIYHVHRADVSFLFDFLMNFDLFNATLFSLGQIHS